MKARIVLLVIICALAGAACSKDYAKSLSASRLKD